MAPYGGLASVYDMLMDDIDYDEWTRYVVDLLSKEGIRDGLVAELGCGTGKLTRRLAAAGYDMIGIDDSPEMLSEARRESTDGFSAAKGKKLPDILYLQQDMRDLELYGTVRAVVSVCDSLNYITKPAELTKVFALINNYLDANGLFLFDFNTSSKYEQMGDSTFAEVRENCAYIWENYYEPESQLNEIDLTLFLKQENGSSYDRTEEIHLQRGYTLQEIKACLQTARLSFVTAYDAYTLNAPTRQSGRIFVVAREGRQEKKQYV